MSSAVRPTNVARVSLLMRTDLLLNSVRANSVDLLKVQNQLSTGLKLARPSDNPAEATTIMYLDSLLERQSQYMGNINYADDYLAATDQALGQSVDLVQEASSLALQSVGMGTDDAGRESNAVIIDQIISQLVTLANTNCRGSYVFAGCNGTEAPFSESDGGVLFGGDLTAMQTWVADDNQIGFSVDGNDTFGAQSQRVVGTADLDPALTRQTLLSDVNGATGLGVRLGSIALSDGVSSAVVDLSGCVTVGDVIDKINAEATFLTVTDPPSGSGLEITSAGNITVQEVGTGNTARDLGIYLATGAGAGVTLNGQDVDARLTLATPVTALAGGAGIDLSSGLIITNSLVDPIAPLTFSSAATLGDVLNTINQAGVAVRAQINEDGTGINVHNLLSGSELTIGENGGTTATDLGIRSMTGETLLADLNGGEGVATTNDAGDGIIQVTARDGTTYDVNLSTATTVQDVMDLINSATGGHVTAALTATGNGIELTDTVSGAADLSVTTVSENGYHVATQLGLEQSVGADTLTGQDVHPAEAEGLFSQLLALRDALRQGGDPAARDEAISTAAAALETSRDDLSNMRGQVGAQMQALESRRTQIEDSQLALESLRSDIRDIDFTEAITRYQNLYTALQANLMTGSQLTSMSLLDFLG